MLERLHIRNYALIDRMDLDFSPGLNVITGETGTGKSIMLKGLSLILGKRADKEAIKDKDAKIVVEGEFDIRPYGLEPLFEALDLDWEPHTVIRREITPSGKSRAFVNDTPVRLETLETLTSRLVDIHSQHQQERLRTRAFRFDLLDAMAGTADLRREFARKRRDYLNLLRELDQLRRRRDEAAAMADYRAYQLAELEQIDWDTDWEEAEARLRRFQHQEEILEKLAEAHRDIEEEPYGLSERLRRLHRLLESLSDRDEEFRELAASAEELVLGLDDLHARLTDAAARYELMDQSEKAELEKKLDKLFALMHKHKVQTPRELKALYEKWTAESLKDAQLDETIALKEKEAKKLREELEAMAEELRQKRLKTIPGLEKEIQDLLASLGMEHSRVRFELTPAESFDEFGKDNLKILLSPDKGRTWGDMAKTASGGELSRIMLALKYLLSRHLRLPTIIFDEIDAGISGDVARKTARLLRDMSRHMQFVVITHLPQTAVMGDTHFKVYKTEEGGKILSRVKALDREARIREIAEMIEGKPPSESALQHAAHLLESRE
ncbi:MAG: DNA repair protein RecN [Chlorobi bacterium]|nr:DNA repair protein RecN [Chlorobiota bacterium]